MILGLLIGIIYSWRIALPLLPFIPLMLVGGVLQIRLTARFAKKEKDMLEEAGKVLYYYFL